MRLSPTTGLPGSSSPGCRCRRCRSTNTVIYLFYGNASIVTSQENKAGVWKGNYAAVYHLGNGIAVGLNDSTVNGNTLTNHGATAASGEISGGAGFNGNSSYLACGVANFPSGNGAYTISGWMNPTQNTHRSKLLSYGNSGTAEGTFFGIDQNNNITIDHFSDDYTSSTAIPNGSWSYLTVTFNGTTDTVYRNGALAFSHVPVGPLQVTLDACTIGSYIDGVNDIMLGSLDEIRVSNAVRSADWIATEYNNQSSPATFYTLGSESGNASTPASIASSAGTPQSATVGTTFATALQATVTNAANNPVSGATVTFTAPANSAGASFGGSATATVITNTNGVATAPTLTANSTAGSYTVTASVSGLAAVASFSLTNNPVSANGYSYSRTITIASTQVPDTNQTNL